MTVKSRSFHGAEQEFMTAESGIVVLSGKAQTAGAMHLYATDLPGFQAWMLNDPTALDARKLQKAVRKICPGQPIDASLRPDHRSVHFPIDFILDTEGAIAGFLVPVQPTGQTLHSALAQNALTDLDRISLGSQILGLINGLNRDGLMVTAFKTGGLVLHKAHLLSFTDWPSLRSAAISPETLRSKTWQTAWMAQVDQILAPLSINIDRPIPDMQNMLWHLLAEANFAAPVQARLYALETALTFAWTQEALTIWRETPQLHRLPVASELVMTMRRLMRTQKPPPGSPEKILIPKTKSRGPVGPMLMDPLPIKFRPITSDPASGQSSTGPNEDKDQGEPDNAIRYSIDQTGPVEDPVRLTIFLPQGMKPSDLAILNRATGEVLAEVSAASNGQRLRLDLQRPDGPTVIALAHSALAERGHEDRPHIHHPPLTRRMLGQPVAVTKTKRRLQRRIVSPGFRRS